MISRLATPPSAEPVTTAQAKEHLRLETSADDTYVATLITAAREHLERLTWRAFINQSWELILASHFPEASHITLPKGSLGSVTHVKYLDEAGTLRTLSSGDYEVDTKSAPGRIHLGHAKSWPLTRDRWDSVQVQYVAGYGSSWSSVPAGLRQAVLLLVAQMYEHRVPEVTGTIVSRVSFAVDALIAPHRLRRF